MVYTAEKCANVDSHHLSNVHYDIIAFDRLAVKTGA